MPSVAVLYIADAVVGPHLELLRLICEPSSQSRPHVTVRYFDRLRVPKTYGTTKIGHIDLLEAARFEDARRNDHHTVFIRCASDDLTPLEHKPHFPASEFHITVYDGSSESFARRVLRLLREVEWGFRLHLPSDTTLASLPIRSRLARQYDHPTLSQPAGKLFELIFGEQFLAARLADASESRRLSLVKATCTHLRQAIRHLPRLGVTSESRAAHAAFQRPTETVSEVHLTPPELARDMAALAIETFPANTPIDFGDPAVGTGAFYSALLQVVPQERVKSALGFDINPTQAAASASRWAHRGLLVRTSDYLHLEELPARNLILANPPYLRHQKIPQDYKKALRERASIRSGYPINARAGAYVYFMLLSHDWMAPGAVAAWLIPAEFMQTDYGEALRWYLTHRVTLLRIHQFNKASPQFENAKVLPAVVLFRNCVPSADASVSLTSGGTLGAIRPAQSIPVPHLRAERRWAIPLRRHRRSVPGDVHIRDLFTVKRGIATGANEFFVMTRSRAVSLGIPKADLRPILPKTKTLEADIIEHDSDGYPLVSPQLFVLDSEQSEEAIAKRHPKMWKYLQEGVAQGLLERNLVKSRRPWYRQERREAAPFLCTYMGRGTRGSAPLRFILNRSNAIVTNTYLMLYPRPTLAALLKRHSHLELRLFRLLQQSANETMSEEWRIHAGGLHKIEPGDLLDVRLASAPRWVLAAVERDLSLVEESLVDDLSIAAGGPPQIGRRVR